MKKVIGISSLLCTLFLALSTSAQAKEIDHKSISDLSKEWTIKFNKLIDNRSISNSSIYVKNSQGNKIDIALKTYDSSDKVTITPKNKYISGENYTIYVTKEIKDKTGVNLEEEAYMNFNVKGAEEDSKTEMGLDEFKLGSIDLSMDKAGIEKLIGKPISIDKDNHLAEFGIVAYNYKNYTIEFFEDYNSGDLIPITIVLKSSAITGPRGIKVGDSVESVLAKFPRENNPIEYWTEILYGEEYKNNGKAFYDDYGNVYRVTCQYGEGTYEVVVFDLNIIDNKVSNMSIWIPPM